MLSKASLSVQTLKDSLHSLDWSSIKSFVTRPANWGKCALAAGSLYFAYTTIYIYMKRRRYSHIPGPPTSGISGFYFGHMNDILEYLKKDKVFSDFLVDCHEKYGEIFRFQFGSEISVFTSNTEAIKEALIVKNFPKVYKFNKTIMFPLSERFLGYGLLTEPDLKIWKNRRAFFNPGFHRNVLMTFVKQFNTITNHLLDKLRQKADGKTKVHLLNEFNRATLDAIAMIAFGLHTNTVMDPEAKLSTYLSHILRLNNELFINPFLNYFPSRFKEVQQFKDEVRYFRKMGRERILESIEAFKNSDSPSVDILSSILNSSKESKLDIETMIDDFMTFFIAGQETTANSLSFSFLELGRHPEIVQKAREEIDRVLGHRNEISYQDVNDLKYCSAIFKEALRLYPPVSNIDRETNEEMTISGYKLPKGTLLAIGTYVNARQEKYFKDAYEFKPERFLKENSDSEESKIEPYTYLPFSLGPRNCIGMNFAQLEGVIIIAKIIQNFDFQLDPDQSFVIEQTLTLRPKDGARCYMTIRQ